MALTKYTYSKDANISVLEDEVLADPGITTALDHIDKIDDADPDTVDIWFVDPITGAEQTALNAVVTAHTNPAVPTANHVHSGIGAPDDQLGHDGDVCIDPQTLKLYEKVAGVWSNARSITGTPTVDDLSDADTTTTAPVAGDHLKYDGTNWVPDAADGKTVLNGTVVPTTEGVDGDFYIRTDTDEIYGPKTAGAWGSPTSLVGPQGAVGPTGPTGADGDVTWQGIWVSQNYVVNQAVEYNGASYVCKLNTVASEVPTNTTYWDVLAAKGDTGSTGPSGSVEFDDQYAASQTDTNTTSTSYVDIDSLTVTTSNTQALDYLVSVNLSVSNSGNGKKVSFRVLADGVEAADSVLNTIDTLQANDRSVISLQCRVNLTTAKEIKVQMLTEAGTTLTIHERSISARGAA